GGSDVLTLPDVANYQLTPTVRWDPTNIFTAGDTAGQSYQITGGDGADSIQLGAGADIVDGRAGDDVFFLSVDDVRDIIDGGDGIDSAIYSTYATGLSVTLRGATPTLVGGSGSSTATSDTIVNIENFAGGSGADTIIGDGNDNTLSGGAGDDYLQDTGGTNTLLGGYGNDTIAVSGAGSNVIDGGAGIDTLNLYRPNLTGPVTVSVVSDGNGNNSYAFSLPDGTTVSNV